LIAEAVNSVSTLISETYLGVDAADSTFQNIKASVTSMFVDIPMDGTSANSTSYDVHIPSRLQCSNRLTSERSDDAVC
jgi:hypothetical protein